LAFDANFANVRNLAQHENFGTAVVGAIQNGCSSPLAVLSRQIRPIGCMSVDGPFGGHGKICPETHIADELPDK